MDIQTAAKYMKVGYRVRRPKWANKSMHYSWISDGTLFFVKLTIEDLLADDWEVITDGIVKDFPITYQD